MDNKSIPEIDPSRPTVSSKSGTFISTIAWVVALSLVAVAVYLGWQTRSATAAATISEVVTIEVTAVPEMREDLVLEMPQLDLPEDTKTIRRETQLHTIIPNRPRVEVKKYTVSVGDSVFEIANKFNIKPETVLWANYDQLNDDPDTISVGMELNIPPIDGVYYEWQEGDTIESIAARFEAELDEILGFSTNKLDLTDPTLEPGSMVMIPGGHREFRQWLLPVIPRSRAGVSSSVYGSGACSGSYEGAYGSGAFVWPAGNHYLSGNDYWSGHLAIDIAAGEGAQVYAADSGVVVFSGWATGGYGYMIMIDHGNGYQSLYGHLSNVNVSCGQSVGSGQTIGYSGSTGNSTGAHLHFEVRFQGGYINPWYVLPAP